MSGGLQSCEGEETGSSEASEQLERYFAAYKAHGTPISVDFRSLSGLAPGSDRATHLIHSYPAKLVLGIPDFFLNCEQLTAPGAHVLDPFCGSGTVLLEALLNGRKADGCDANPLARLITLVKSRPIGQQALLDGLTQIMSASLLAAPDIPDVVNRTFWFSDRISVSLGKLRAAILTLDDPVVTDFFWVCLSACARRVSRADPRLSVPVRINPERAPRYGAKGAEVVRRFKALDRIDVGAVFWRIAAQNISRMAQFCHAVRPDMQGRIVGDDARQVGSEDGTYDMILTSPPYVGAQKYIRASSLNLGWLGLTPNSALRPYERLSIGREHLSKLERSRPHFRPAGEAAQVLEDIDAANSLRADIARIYLSEMQAVMREAARVVRSKGHMVMVIGANEVAGKPFDTPRYVQALAEGEGFVLRAHLQDSIRSRGLMVKRNKTASIITCESVLIMQHVGATRDRRS